MASAIALGRDESTITRMLQFPDARRLGSSTRTNGGWINYRPIAATAQAKNVGR
jgi:hypothetical protein